MANEKTVSTKSSEEHVSTAFKWFHATSVNGGAMIIAAVISSYFSVYMTDTMGLPAASASLIMFIATFWDACNDPMMGVIADRTKSRWGRYRPYFIAAPILLTLFSVLIWVNPDFSTTGKFVWVLVTYIGYGMTVTMYTMPQVAVLPACVKSNERRNMIITMGAGVCAVAFLIGNTFTPNLTGFFNNLGFSNGYIPLMICCGILSFISFWGLFATSKERYLQPVQKGESLKNLKKVLKHVELFPNIIAWIMASMGYGLMFSTSVYYMTYYYERPDLIPVYMLVISIGATVSMVVLMPIVLKIFKTGQKSLIFSQATSIVCYLILFFFGRSNFMFLCVMTFISSCLSSMQNALVNVLVNDAIDYVQLKEGISANGVIASIKGFAQKCGNTFTSSGILAVLAVSGYVANAIGEQPDSAMFALNFLKFGAPCVTGIILIIAVLINPVAKYYKDIEEMKAKMEANE